MKRSGFDTSRSVIRIRDRAAPKPDELRAGALALIRVAGVVMEESSELRAISAEWITLHVELRTR